MGNDKLTSISPRCHKVADDDPRQLHIGVRCVLENLLLSLLAALHGIWCQPMSQVVHIPELKEEVASIIAESEFFPKHPLRIGFAPAEKQHTMRPSLGEVMA